MATYELAGQRFSSKEAVAAHAKAIKDAAHPGQILTGDDLAFMYALLLWHPDAATKIGVGVRILMIRANPMFGHNEFYLMRVDGSSTEFSYKQCVQPSTPQADFRTACRVAISPDIVEFGRAFFSERKLGLHCPITGDELTGHNAHVDHEPPNTFQTLLQDFIDLRGLDPSRVPLTGRAEDNSFRVRIADPELEADWIEFHRQNAHLRVISQEANLKIVGHDWGRILEYLWAMDHADVLIEWKGSRRYYTHMSGLERGILLGADKAPKGTPILDGTIALIEMSLMSEVSR